MSEEPVCGVLRSRARRAEKAVEEFETCCRLEPPYREHVRDYMAFIELNGLVAGVTGYLERDKESA